MTMPAPFSAAFDVSAPAAPSNEAFCVVYGKLIRLDGSPLPFLPLHFSPVHDSGHLPPAIGLAAAVAGDLRVTTGRDGVFAVTLPLATSVLISAPWLGNTVSFSTPEIHGSYRLFDVLFPYPVSLDWYVADESSPPTPSTLETTSPGFVTWPADESVLRLCLCAVWSDGRVLPLQSPKIDVTVDGAVTSSLSAYTLALSATGAGEAVVTCVESEQGYGMWARVGYVGTDQPQRISEHVHALLDAPPLTVTFT